MKKKIISAVLSAVMILPVLAGCGQQDEKDNTASDLSYNTQEFSINTQEKNIFVIDGNKYYSSGTAIVNINDNSKPEIILTNKDEFENMKAEDNPESIWLNYSCSIMKDNEIIQFDRFDNSIRSIKLENNETVEKKIIFNNGSWAKYLKDRAELSKMNSETDLIELSDYIMSHSSNWIDGDDGYIYFLIDSDYDDFDNYLPFNYCIGRFSIKGDTVELYDDIRASSLTYFKGKIYYFDNGYTFHSGTFDIDENRIGLYCIKPDDKDKTKLVDGFSLSEEDKKDLKWACEHIGDRLEIIGNTVYYIAEDSTSDTYLYKLEENGSVPEKVVSDPCADYYIDVDSDILIYQKGSLNCSPASGCVVCLVDLSNGNETILYRKFNAPSSGSWASVDGDYLYITNPAHFKYCRTYIKEEEFKKIGSSKLDTPSGQRFNMKTKTMESLWWYSEVKEGTEYDDLFGRPTTKTIVNVGAEWVEDEGEKGQDGIIGYI